MVPVNQLEKSFNLIGHMIFFRISGFSGFSGSGSGNPDLLLSRIDPGVKTDPMVPHMWLKPCWRPRFTAALALCNIDYCGILLYCQGGGNILYHLDHTLFVNLFKTFPRVDLLELGNVFLSEKTIMVRQRMLPSNKETAFHKLKSHLVFGAILESFRKAS